MTVNRWRNICNLLRQYYFFRTYYMILFKFIFNGRNKGTNDCYLLKHPRAIFRSWKYYMTRPQIHLIDVRYINIIKVIENDKKKHFFALLMKVILKYQLILIRNL